jgi:transcriptional regulator
MYTPNSFHENRPEVLHELIRAYPLGAIVTQTASGLDANHIPFYFDPQVNSQGESASEFQGALSGKGSLLGHVARQNPIWQNLQEGTRVMVLFQGPSAYISPSWYPTKMEHGRVVPTWNYVVVHVHGILRVHDDPNWVWRQMNLLTRQMENSREAPWAVSDAPMEYLDRLMAGIVGMELIIDRIEGKWKVSQNQQPANRAGAIAGLEATGEPSCLEMARIMRAFAP